MINSCTFSIPPSFETICTPLSVFLYIRLHLFPLLVLSFLPYSFFRMATPSFLCALGGIFCDVMREPSFCQIHHHYVNRHSIPENSTLSSSYDIINLAIPHLNHVATNFSRFISLLTAVSELCTHYRGFF